MEDRLATAASNPPIEVPGTKIRQLRPAETRPAASPERPMAEPHPAKLPGHSALADCRATLQTHPIPAPQRARHRAYPEAASLRTHPATLLHEATNEAPPVPGRQSATNQAYPDPAHQAIVLREATSRPPPVLAPQSATSQALLNVANLRAGIQGCPATGMRGATSQAGWAAGLGTTLRGPGMWWAMRRVRPEVRSSRVPKRSEECLAGVPGRRRGWG
ncbi:hypothetical protein Aph01nite_28000 [Acrocarpospora phusangensis]|uniref:Uncharacterized protein n=1 Tax=Acrocarpospora phusangensis TaxID=1070424 RepID=A0A919QDB7_9ACTN|nr:hypothetical protein Aph01nite_28000 [Acrocarpospora phusangensis]